MSDTELSQSTVVFGLRMWVLVGIGVGAAFVLLLVLISVLCLLAFRRRRRRRRRQRPANPAQQLPTTAPPKNPTNAKAPKDIQEVPSHAAAAAPAKTPLALAQVLQLPTPPVSEQLVTGKEHHVTHPEQQQQHPSHRSDGPSPHGNGESRGGAAERAPPAVPEVSHLGWGHWYTLKELETATGMFADGNVIGEGGYGIVYRGVLGNGTQVAVKNLLNNRYRTTYQ